MLINYVLRSRFILCILAFTCVSAFAKPDNAVQKDINAINKYFDSLALKEVKFKKINMDFVDFESTEGAEGDAIYLNNNLVKVRLTAYGEMGNTKWEFLLKNAEIVYIFEVSRDFDKPIYMAERKQINSGSNKYYFKGGKLIYKLLMDKENQSTEAELKDIFDSLNLCKVNCVLRR